MDIRRSISIKVISVVVLFFFCWTFGGLFDIAYAAKSEIEQASQNKPKKEKPEEKFEKTLNDLEQALLDTETDTNTKKNKAKGKKSEIELLDVEIKKQFANTEKKLKDEGLPQVILERHYTFVNHYEENLKELQKNLDDIEKAETKAETDNAIENTKNFLEKVKPPKKHVPLDPNKLPHRTPEPKFIDPRTSPEQFKTEQTTWDISKKNPILVASNGPLTGLLNSSLPDAYNQDPILLAQADPPTSADLAETIEVKFTPAIQAKAAELNHDPVKIYNWVRNNIEFVPTYGSIQGADYCLQTKQGNAFDTASLLIALLRASGIHARYVYGTIELPIEKVKNWAGGFTDTNSAMSLIASGRIPLKGLTSGGKIVSAQMEHVWVEAWIDYIPSRGARHKTGQGDTWIPLDASFKQYEYIEGIDIKTAVPFDAQSFLNQIQSTATIDQTAGYATNVNSLYIQQTMQDYQTQVQNYITQNYPNATSEDILGGKEIIRQNFPYLLGTLPYKTVATGARYSTLPDSLRHKIILSVNDEDEFTIAHPLTVTRNLAEISGKRVTLNYLPAQASDAAVLEYYGYYSAPPYLVNVKPVLFIEGVQVASGDPVGMGSGQSLKVAFIAPNRSTEIVAHPLNASAMVAIGLDLQKITPELLGQRNAMLQAAFSKIGEEEVSIDDLIGEVLNVQSLIYLYTHELFNKTAAGMNVVYTKQPAEMAVMINPVVEYLYSIPYQIKTPTMQFDVARYVMARKSLSGDRNQEKSFTFLTGLLSSAMEHGIFDLVDSNSKAISTIKALALANEAGIPIYRINASNSSDILPRLQVLPDTLQNVRNAIASGKEVFIPERTIQYYQWVGDGYLILDPSTGAGSYLIAGGLMGGANACDVASVWKWQSYSTLSGAAGYCENHAVGITGWLVGIKNQLITWTVPRAAEIAGKIGTVVAGIGALVAALIKVAMIWDNIQSPLGRVLIGEFTFCVSVLSWWLINWIFLNTTNPIAGAIAAIALGYAVLELTDHYVAAVKSLEEQLSYYFRRREIEV